MEESEKRRERLKAMRMEAACSKNSNNVSFPVPSNLSNPLVETPEALHDGSSTASRFGFYTDPMAAFSVDKTRNNAGPRNPVMTPPVAHQFQSNYSPNHMYQPRGYGNNPNFQRSPMYQPQGYGNNPNFQRSPMGIYRPTMDQVTPDAWNGTGGAAAYNFSPNPSRECNFPSPGFGPTGSPSFNTGQGRGNWFNNSPSPGFGIRGSPSPSSGRGRDKWWSGRSPASGQRGGRGNFSPGSGRRGGRGLGYRPSATDTPLGPENYYDNSMVEDPWKCLEPVIWKGVNDPLKGLGTSESSRSSFSGTKRAKTSEAPSNSNKQPSLAEYLAASLNEAVNDESSL